MALSSDTLRLTNLGEGWRGYAYRIPGQAAKIERLGKRGVVSDNLLHSLNKLGWKWETAGWTVASVDEQERQFVIKARLKTRMELSAPVIYVTYEITRRAEGREIPVLPPTPIRVGGPLGAESAFEVEIPVGRSGLAGARTARIVSVSSASPAP